MNNLMMSNSIHKPAFLLWSFLLLFSAVAFGQSSEMKQKIEAFHSDHSSAYSMKYLNIDKRELGSIYEQEVEWKDEFMLKSKEKEVNNLGNKSYAKFYISIFGFETEEDRQYSLKYWLENFIEGKSVRPGRVVRSYDYAVPTIILINQMSIITVSYDCSDYSDENFEFWKKEVLTYFGEENSMMIEILCDGPMEWTLNAPDPKTRDLF